MSKADDVESTLRETIKNDLTYFQMMVIILMVVCLTFSGLIGVIFDNFMRGRFKYEQKLGQTNQMLEKANTQLLSTEQQLRGSESRYRDLFENISSGVAVYEAIDNGNDFIFRDFNQAGEKI